ncbi:multicopper oxidase [Peniophora sp. CONT]|nr:multicopper oxidase [Peniophora sp. CONT]
MASFSSVRACLCLSLLSLVSGTFAATVFKTLDIVNRNISLDGYTRPAVLANSEMPGPVISGNKGDTFHITVKNSLHDESMDVLTTIHWHGIDQKHTAWADGVASVTQCPIVPGGSFEYKFKVDGQAGTYWWHSHYSEQYCDGERGALIVRDPQDPHRHLYDVDDDDTIIALADWYHYTSHENSPTYAPTPSSTLINGKARYSGALNIDLAVVGVKKGLRYRMRLISMACDPNFLFSIDQHTLKIIEADGTNVQPVEVSQIQIFAGQRYSFVLHANQKVDNYWIRALPDIGTDLTADGGLNSAILRYNGAKKADPRSEDSLPHHLLLETELHPLVVSPPPPADETITLNVAWNGSVFLVNNQTWVSPEVPVLLQMMSGAKKASDLMPLNSVYSLKRDKVYDLLIPGGADFGPHPIHMHGHSFWVITSAGSDNTQNNVDPVIRDVVAMGAGDGDEIRIRFLTSNPGPWFLHCHIDQHLEAGLAVVFAEDADDTSQEMSAPAQWDDLCPAYESFLAKSSSTPGHSGHHHTHGHGHSWDSGHTFNFGHSSSHGHSSNSHTSSCTGKACRRHAQQRRHLSESHSSRFISGTL